ncbi:hypothetical protein D3C71_1812570 [compost metagenome]
MIRVPFPEQLLFQAGEAFQHEPVVNFLLARELKVDGAFAVFGLVSDVIHRRRGIALVFEQLLRGTQYGIPVKQKNDFFTAAAVHLETSNVKSKLMVYLIVAWNGEAVCAICGMGSIGW